MMRLDKFLVTMEICSRSQAKDIVKQGHITINGQICKKADIKINEDVDIVAYKGQPIQYNEFYYYMLHKPQDVVTATQDNHDKTVMELLDSNIRRKDLFPVGRLDKDTEGLLLITNDGELAHLLLSPKRHVDKTYLVHLAKSIDEESLKKLSEGVDIGEDELTLPANVVKVDDKIIHLTIHEGKFHQVKRMLKAVGNEVVYLKRLTFGSLTLDESLICGSYRPLTDHEIIELRKAVDR
jgi:16S rRNA pseudouridine516 synthase